MKIFLFLICVPILVSSQLKVEWKEELTGNYTGVSGLICLGGKIYITQTGDQVGSAFNIFSTSGTELFRSTTFARIRSFFTWNNALYSMGDQQLTMRSLSGEIVSEYTLPWKGGEYVSSRNGKILNNRAYTTNWHNDFLKFSLTGEQLFRKEIGTLTDNHFLDVGGNFIYVLSSITNQGNRLMQYDTLGNQNWSLQVGMVTNILADKQGNCYFFSVQPQTSNIVNKINPNGELVWSQVVPGQVILDGFLHGDSLFVCGSESIDVAIERHQNPTFSILSAASGTILHQQVLDFYSGDEGFGEGFSKIAYDGNALYLAGHTGSQGVKNFLVKLSREGNTTGLPGETQKRSFTIFPNPSGSKFTISCSELSAASLKVTVRNSLGQVVHKDTLSCNDQKSYELDLGKQAAGNYTVEIMSGDQKTVKKIVVE